MINIHIYMFFFHVNISSNITNKCISTYNKQYIHRHIINTTRYRGEENEMYKINFIQRLWQGCIHIIDYIKFNKRIL